MTFCRHHDDCESVEKHMQATHGVAATHCHDDPCMHFEVRKQTTRCLKCERIMKPALNSGGADDALDCPGGGISFDGGWNYGSTLYDAAIPQEDGYGIHVTVVV